jgi:serine/threonine protein kinase
MSNPPQTRLDDLLDQIVSEYSQRVTQGQGEQTADLLARVPAEHRPTLERCFKMIRAGLDSGPAPRRALGPGEFLDGYRILREIGRGGMAVVYEATQEDLERPVALKVLRAGLALEQRNIDRFKREALAVARLQHPHIVAIHGVGEADGYHYIAMELVQGTTLEEVYRRLPTERREWTADDLADAAQIPALADGGVSYDQALCRLLAPVVRAVGLAHELGMVHRDLKPSNILIHGDGRPVVADFGLAKADGDPALSLTGEPLGTPYYMSPEQAAVIQEPVDARSDVYSLGVTLYEGLTGRRPFEGQTLYEVLDAIRTRPVPPPRLASRASGRRGVGRDADAVSRKATARLPGQRYPLALEFSADLDAVGEGRMTLAGAQDGGPLRRMAGGVMRAWLLGGNGQEYISHTKFLGLPLVHINLGPRVPGQPLRRAKGWLAVGEVAIGVLAFGPFAIGLIAFGALGLGGMVGAGMGLGLVTFAGLSLGILATGGMAVGVGALGGMAIGLYAQGGLAVGPHAGSSGAIDPEAAEFMGRWMFWSGL